MPRITLASWATAGLEDVIPLNAWACHPLSTISALALGFALGANGAPIGTVDNTFEKARKREKRIRKLRLVFEAHKKMRDS